MPKLVPTLAQETYHAEVLLLIWDGTQYQLNYNHNHHSISVWDGTTHTDIVYDNNDDATDYEYNDYDKCGATYDYAYGDSFNMNDPSIRLQFKKCLQVVQDHNDNMKKYIKTVPQVCKIIT